MMLKQLIQNIDFGDLQYDILSYENSATLYIEGEHIVTIFGVKNEKGL